MKKFIFLLCFLLIFIAWANLEEAQVTKEGKEEIKAKETEKEDLDKDKQSTHTKKKKKNKVTESTDEESIDDEEYTLDEEEEEIDFESASEDADEKTTKKSKVKKTAKGKGTSITNKEFEELQKKSSKEREKEMQSELEQNDNEDEDGDEDDEEFQNNLTDQWEKYMNDFVPSDLLSFTVEDTEELIEEVTVKQIPAYLRGAYFVSSSEDKTIDFAIIDPENKTLIYQAYKTEEIFFFHAKIEGEYRFVFTNLDPRDPAQITFAFHNSKAKNENTKEEPKKDLTNQNKTEIEEYADKISGVTKLINQIEALHKVSDKRQDIHYITLIKADKKVLSFTIFETITIIAATMLQIYYIEKLLDNKIIV